MPLPDAASTPAPLWKRGIGCFSVGIFIAVYAFITLWDFALWAIYGTSFLFSPHYSLLERRVGSAACGGYIFFMGIDGGSILLKEKKYGLFILAFLVFIFAGMPVAKLLLVVCKAMIFKGWIVFSKPRAWVLSGWMLMAVVCKVRVWMNIFMLFRPTQANKDTRHIVIEAQ